MPPKYVPYASESLPEAAVSIPIRNASLAVGGLILLGLNDVGVVGKLDELV
jgi:hypothetical protein